MSTADVQQATSSPSLDAPQVTAERRSDLNGQLVALEGLPEVYLVDQGLKRHIPDFHLFKPHPKIISFDTKAIEGGSPVLSNSVLIRDHRPPIYLVDLNPEKGSNQIVKRHIVSPDVLKQYQFGHVATVPSILVDAIPQGQDVVMPTHPPKS